MLTPMLSHANEGAAEELVLVFSQPDNTVGETIVRLLDVTGILQLVTRSSAPGTIRSSSLLLVSVADAVCGRLDPSVSWLQPSGLPRWKYTSLPHISVDLSMSSSIVRLLCDGGLGMTSTVYPLAREYDGVLFLGGALPRVISRASFLRSLLSSGLTCRRMYILTGPRDLQSDAGETDSALFDACGEVVATEEEMVPLVLSRMLDVRTAFSDVTVVSGARDADYGRATTESSVRAWLTQCEVQGGRYLAISNQPFVFYQQLVIDRTVREARTLVLGNDAGPGVDCVGPTCLSCDQTTCQFSLVLLDTCARILNELSRQNAAVS
eukprot:ANDGO_06020.mRNA.1 hypothetical protein